MLSCHRENDPLGNIHRMVADALKVLGDHQKVERKFTVGGILRNALDKSLLHAGEIIVHRIIFGDVYIPIGDSYRQAFQDFIQR